MPVLFDNVIPKHSLHLLDRLVLVVLGATLIQGITSFALTQLLSKEAQRLITELRQRVQKHISRLPVAFYDANKTGMLVSRIMSDVEGVRNLLGTGLVDFAGGLLTSAIALVLLLRISAVMTSLALGFLLCFALALTKAFGTIRPIFRERGKINAEVTGRLTESLGGVRVIKGYHAEEREEAVFAGGVKRLLENIMRTLTATSVIAFAVMGDPLARRLIDSAKKRNVVDLSVVLSDDLPVWWTGAGVGHHRQPFVTIKFGYNPNTRLSFDMHMLDSHSGTHLVPPSYALPDAGFDDRTYSPEVRDWLAEYEKKYGRRGPRHRSARKAPSRS